MRDVARLAGVSTATVSFAINNNPHVSPELRARVMAAIEQTGYAPDAAACALRRGVAPSIGLIVIDITNRISPRSRWRSSARLRGMR